MKQNRYNTDASYVAAEPVTVETPRADIIRRQDVVTQVGRLVDVYQEQQRAALQSVQTDVTRGGYLSTAEGVAERRKTSLMYLIHNTGVVGMVSAGMVLLAHGAGYMDAGGAFATWLALTGGLALLLGRRGHADEFRHSPEGIARHVVDAHWSLSEYEAETRRKAIQWEHEAEQRRQAAQEQANEHARQLAALRVEEMEARRRATDAANERRSQYWHAAPAMAVQDARSGAIEDGRDVFDLDTATASSGPSSTVDAGNDWQAALIGWVAGLYTDGATVGNGVIRGRVPWSARSSWSETDKREARRVCCDLKPALIVPADGNRWRLRIEMFETEDLAMRVLTGRLQ